ncbi:MAG: chromate transporter [Clostridia bacterium]|nr:chromate transporter [Clostridia bacterium]
MEKQPKLLGKLFISVFLLSAFTFGGGYVIVPLMRKKFVEQLKWIDEQEMLDLVAIGQSSPGPIAINTAVLVGYRICGVIGSLIAVFGAILPPLIIITVVSLFYAAFRDNKIVSLVMHGMQIGVAAVIGSVVISMAKQILKKERVLSVIMMVAVLIASAVYKVNVGLVVITCALIGLLDTMFRARREKAK